MKHINGRNNTLCGVKAANQIIKEYLHSNGISKTALGAKLTPALKQQAIWKKLDKRDLDTGFIKQVSDALEHNFFADLAAEYNDVTRRENFDVGQTVSEPNQAYGPVPDLEKALRKIVRDEMKKK